MPLYDFKCLDCGEQFEALVLKNEPACPACQSHKLEQLISMFSVDSASIRQSNINSARQGERQNGARQSHCRSGSDQSSRRLDSNWNPLDLSHLRERRSGFQPLLPVVWCSAPRQRAACDADFRHSLPHSTPARTPSHSRLRSSSGSLGEGRFLPGALLAGRYRIVALLGRGGMGEVYRAHDLTLGQEVALKFLPEVAASNPAALARFYNEVRIARQVSHANVCRVYDLGEVDGQPYLSMEYVDGEDLGSLLRRIGRLPSDKAVEIARQLCAGLAAAHAKGVLHRDLKPANVMLNGRGTVVITDFGLAALADEIPGEEIRNGTPAYMAPEQLAGREVTVQSDIYSLGLVLYEVFTGKRAFDASTLAELVRLHSETTPVSPSTLVKELDPAVENAILRCLDPEPSNRPSSALAVAARLPGGDPLAAALAAGETPSPQLVAASGSMAALPFKIALPTLIAALAGLALFAVLAATSSMLEKSQLTKSAEVLADKARDLVQTPRLYFASRRFRLWVRI